MNKSIHKIFNDCYLGKYKIYNVIATTPAQFDIILLEPNEHIYYQFKFFYDGLYNGEIFTFRWDKKLYGNNSEKLNVEVTREEVGNDVFDSVCNIATFLLKNGFIKNEKYY